MNDRRPGLTSDEIAAIVVDALDRRRQIEPISDTVGEFNNEIAYDVAARVMRLRGMRGERPVGRKIGFTNRSIWPQYGVCEPIWGYLYDTTVREIDADAGSVDLSSFLEPRIEPEIVLGLGETPDVGMDEAELLSCVDWIAHGFEIVHSIFPGWRFSSADTVAAFGLHGAYRIGPRHEVNRHDAADWQSSLPKFEIALKRDGEVIDRGSGGNVLDGPLTALRHLVSVLDKDAFNPPLAAGEMVTTGTLTAAHSVNRGEHWSTEISGLPIDGIEIRFC